MSTDVILVNPKWAHNVGNVRRALSCFASGELVFTGDRVLEEIEEAKRIPREERMKGYDNVPWRQDDRPFDSLKGTPVAIELLPSSQPLHTFEHPEDPIYVFGPEDGSIPSVLRRHCHHFVAIPAAHCLNLSAAVYITLWDRAFKRDRDGIEPMPVLKEDRGHWAYDRVSS